MRYSPSLRGVQDDRRNTGRAFVGRPTIDAPGFEHRSPGGVAGAPGDTYWTGMRRARQERSERDDPPDSTALGHIEERLRIGAPLLMRLRDRKSTRLNSSHANISYAVF